MKTKAFQTKRRAKSGLRLLHAKTRKRKQRVSAAASGGDFAVEEPNLGVARALIVILILHIAAIGAIVVHHNTTKDDLASTSSPAASSQSPTISAKTAPQIGPNDRHHWVGGGDTYERIAQRYNVDVAELRRLNENHTLVGGMALKIPAEKALPNQEVLASLPSADPLISESLPPIQEVPARHGLPAEYEIVENAPQSAPIPEPFPRQNQAAPESSMVVEHASIATREEAPAPVRETPPAPPATKTYTVRSGDTMWAIANRNGISQQKLVSANRNVDPRKMKIGMKLVIPAP